MQTDRIYCGDALTVLKTLPDSSVNCCITSPPYYALRDYGMAGQLGREETPALYVERLTSIFREVRRVLTPDGTLWLNIADTYAGNGPPRRPPPRAKTPPTITPHRQIRPPPSTPSTPTAGRGRSLPSTARWRAARQRI